MESITQDHLQRLRSESAYPTYRGIISTIMMLFYALACLTGLASLVSGLGAMSQSFMGGLLVLGFGGVVTAIIFVFAQVCKETSLILVDIGDAVIEATSRK